MKVSTNLDEGTQAARRRALHLNAARRGIHANGAVPLARVVDFIVRLLLYGDQRDRRRDAGFLVDSQRVRLYVTARRCVRIRIAGLR